MAVTFRSIVAELWASMGQEPPDLDGEDAIDLTAEDLSVRLEEYGDGRRLLVSTEVGPLAADQMRRTQQVQQILADNLALLSSRRGCVHLRSGADDPPVLVVSGVHSYDDRVSDLSGLIDDMLFLREWHAEALRDGAAPRSRVPSEIYERNNVIFNP